MSSSQGNPTGRPESGSELRVAVLILTALLMLGLAYWYLASGLLVPHPYLAILWVAWLGFALLAWAFRRRPFLALLVPVSGASFWIGLRSGTGDAPRLAA
jgi:hypothetical protein